jgi:hypothetical protein
MASIEIHGHVWKVKSADSVLHALLVSCLGVGALGDAQVGNQIGEGIRLCTLISSSSDSVSSEIFTNDENDWDSGVGNKDIMDRVNVGLVLGDTIIGNTILSVRGKCGTVTIWQVIDDELPSNI